MTEPLPAIDLPDSVRRYQYSRCALYLSHIAFYQARVRPRLGEQLRAVEFGGSNGFIPTSRMASCRTSSGKPPFRISQT